MNSSEQVNDAMILEYLHQLYNLPLGVIAFLSHLDLVVEIVEALVN